MPAITHNTYIRDDGCLMVEIRPNEYVEESIAERLGLLRYATGGIVQPGNPYLVGEQGRESILPQRVYRELILNHTSWRGPITIPL